MKKKVLIIGISIVFLLIAAGVAAKVLLLGSYEYEPVRVEIPAGATSEDVGNILRDTLGKNFGDKTARLWRIQNGKPTKAHGSYLVSPGESSLQLSRRLSQGLQTPVRLTFNNMRTVGDLSRRVSEVLELDSAAFHAAADSVLAAQGLSAEQEPSAFIPDTYEFYWTADAPYVVDRLFAERQTFWNDERRAAATRLGLSPEDVHTLASIVEGETAKADERPVVARLYLNRLAIGMPLQADPTVKFALKDPTLRRITSEHLKVESPYNTYSNQGLPPGPISIAERSTLQAVLDAPDHKYLYMCAKPDFSGYHDFATDYNRHRINAARYHRALAARGIK